MHQGQSIGWPLQGGAQACQNFYESFELRMSVQNLLRVEAAGTFAARQEVATLHLLVLLDAANLHVSNVTSNVL